MYSSQQFEEAAFGIYIKGMIDYELICEKLLLERFDNPYEVQKILDDAQKIFTETAGIKTE